MSFYRAFWRLCLSLPCRRAPRACCGGLIVPAVIGLLLIFLPKTAYGHAELMQSTPENGAQLATPPEELVLFFSEGVQTGELALLDFEGNPLDMGSFTITDQERRTVEATLPPLAEGIYTVRWQVLAEDGHVTGGSFFFVVGEAMPTRGQLLDFLVAQSEPARLALQPVEPVARGLIFLALAGLLGIPLTWALVIVPARRQTGIHVAEVERRFLGRLLQVAGVVVVLGSALLIAGQYAALHAGWDVDSLAEFLVNMSSGNLALLRVALGIGLFAVGRFVPGSDIRATIAALGGLLLAWTLNRSSHAATLLPNPAVLVDLAHLLAAGIWAGGLAWLLWLTSPRVASHIGASSIANHGAVEDTTQAEAGAGESRAAAAIQPLVAAAGARFSVLALATVTVAVATGLLLTAWLAPAPQAFWETLYGSALAVKLGLVVIAVGLGAAHRYLTLSRLEATETGRRDDRHHQLRHFRYSIRAEVAAVVGIMLVTGLLTSAPPAALVMAGQIDNEAQFGATVIEGELGTTPILVEIIPFQVGLNVFDVTFPVNTPELDNFTLLLRLPDREIELPAFELTEVESGFWSAVGALPVAGHWEARASAFADGSFQAERFEIALEVDHSHHDHAHGEHPHGDEHGAASADGDPGGVADTADPRATEGNATEGRDFASLLRLLAGIVAAAGTIVVIYDIRRVRQA